MDRRGFVRGAAVAAAGATLKLTERRASAARRSKPKKPRDTRPYAEIREVNQATVSELLAAPREGWRPWQWIVVHHTAAEYASLEGIDRYHRNHFGDPLGAEYHFVINNGRKKAKGLIEAARWRHQELAAHLFHPERAPESLAICLIGNFEEREVPEEMSDALASLTKSLMGALSIPVEQVTSHRAVDGRLTQCPGKHFDLADLRSRVAAS